MRSVIFIAMTTIILSSCGGGNAAKDPQSDPKNVAEAIFDAARNGKYDGLASLIDAEADEDSKRIAQVASDESLQKDFQKYFSKGKVAGDPKINGETAAVAILFGPEGTSEETFEMVRKDGKWYLSSF